MRRSHTSFIQLNVRPAKVGAFTSPITSAIYLNPVRLIPASKSNWDKDTAIVEKQAWDDLVVYNQQHGLTLPLCPKTKLPIDGYIRDFTMEEKVREYLDANPSQRIKQYKEHEHTYPSAPETDDHVCLKNFALSFVASSGPSVANLIGASMLNLDNRERNQAFIDGLLGIQLIWTVIGTLKDSHHPIKKPVFYQEGQSLLSNTIRGASYLALFISLGVVTSVIAQLILQQSPENKMELSHLIKASALGMTFIAAPPLALNIWCNLMREQNEGEDRQRLLNAV